MRSSQKYQYNKVKDKYQSFLQQQQIKVIFMHLSQDKEEEQSIPQIASLQNVEKFTTSRSDPQKIAQYIDYFKISESEVEEKINWRKAWGGENSKKFQDNIAVKVIGQSPKDDFLLLKVRIGDFTIPQISIANFDQQSPVHKCEIKKQGGFGCIYICESFGKKVAVKCIKKQINDQSVIENLTDVLKQYAYQYYAANAMFVKAGSALSDCFGYNIAVYSDCIEFAMQSCLQPKDIKCDRQDIVDDLKTNLLAMHCYKVFHLDIKPENVLFSPTFNRFVFCDIGFSVAKREFFGYKSKTNFRGTLGNWSSEMRELYSSEATEGEVDLYVNDFQCLRNTIPKLLNLLEEVSIQKKEDLYYQQSLLFDLTDFHFLSTLKFLLYKEEYDKVIKLTKEYPSTREQLQQLFVFGAELLHRIQVNVFFKREFPEHYEYLNVKEDTRHSTSKSQSTTKDNTLLKSVLTVSNDSYNVLFEILQNDHQQIAEMLPFHANHPKAIKSTYLILISVVLNLSTRQLSLHKLLQIAKEAKKLLSISQQVGPFVKTQALEIAEVSLFLFQKSLMNGLSGIFLDIFANVVSNVGFLQLISYEQVEHIFRKILSFSLSIKQRIKALMGFFSLYKILHFSSQDILKFQYLAQIIEKIVQRYIQQKFPPQNHPQFYLYEAIQTIFCALTDKPSFITRAYHQSFFGKDFLLIYNISFAKHTHQPYVSSIRQIISFKQDHNRSRFQYCHFYLMLQEYKWKTESKKMDQLLDRYCEVRLINKPNHWKIFWESKILEKENMEQQHYAIFIDYFLSFDKKFPYTYDLDIDLSSQIIFQWQKEIILLAFTMYFYYHQYKYKFLISKHYQNDVSKFIHKTSYQINALFNFQREKILDKIYQWNNWHLQLKKSSSAEIRVQLIIYNNLYDYIYKIVLNKTKIKFSINQLLKFKQLYKQVNQLLPSYYDSRLKLIVFIVNHLHMIWILATIGSFQISRQLFRKLFLLIKATNQKDSIYYLVKALENFKRFRQARYSIYGQKFIMLKDIYLYLASTQKSLDKLSCQQIIKTILVAFNKFHLQALPQYIRQILFNLRLTKGENFRMMVMQSLIQLFSCWRVQCFNQYSRLIYNELTVQNNPYHILVLSLTYFYEGIGNFQQLYYDFYKAAYGIPFILRSFLLFYINYLYIIKNMGSLKKRKLRNLVKTNIIWGGHSLTTENVFQRLVERQTRRKLKLKIFWRNRKIILTKIRKYVEMNHGNKLLLQKFFHFL